MAVSARSRVWGAISGEGLIPSVTDDMRELVLSTLTSVASDRKASPSARTAAARTLAEVLGMLKQAPSRSGGALPVGELSEGELDALIASRVSVDTTKS
jgi:hypothetical protein